MNNYLETICHDDRQQGLTLPRIRRGIMTERAKKNFPTPKRQLPSITSLSGLWPAMTPATHFPSQCSLYFLLSPLFWAFGTDTALHEAAEAGNSGVVATIN